MFNDMKTAELELLLEKKMNEIYDIRQELARRKGDMPKPITNYDFEGQYLTD